MSDLKVEREHLAPLSSQVLVKFGFVSNEKSGYYLGKSKVHFDQNLRCSDYLLQTVMENTALPTLEKSGSLKYLEPEGQQHPLLWHLAKCIIVGETSSLFQHLDHTNHDLPLKHTTAPDSSD